MKMMDDPCVEHPLFGGAITCSFPLRFKDVSTIRDVPDNQEVFANPSRDESIIIELLELKDDIADNESASWFLQDLANEQDSSQDLVVESLNHVPSTDIPFLDPSTSVMVAVGKLAVSKGRQGNEARNLVRVWLANIRLRSVSTDILITLYEPLVINELSESAAVVGSGPSVPAALTGHMTTMDIFKLALSTFKIVDWNVFGA